MYKIYIHIYIWY